MKMRGRLLSKYDVQWLLRADLCTCRMKCFGNVDRLSEGCSFTDLDLLDYGPFCVDDL